MKKIPYAIIIMDGYGLAPASDGNAVCLNGSKNVCRLMEEYPSSKLGASRKEYKRIRYNSRRLFLRSDSCNKKNDGRGDSL